MYKTDTNMLRQIFTVSPRITHSWFDISFFSQSIAINDTAWHKMEIIDRKTDTEIFKALPQADAFQQSREPNENLDPTLYRWIL